MTPRVGQGGRSLELSPFSVDYSRPWLFLSFHFLSQVLTGSLLGTLESVTKLLKRIKLKAYGALTGIK